MRQEVGAQILSEREEAASGTPFVDTKMSPDRDPARSYRPANGKSAFGAKKSFGGPKRSSRTMR